MDECLPAAVVGPCVVLLGAEVDLLEFIHAFVAEERVLERAHAVLTAEEEPEGVLRIARAATEGAADADACGHVELVRGIRRVYLLHLDRTLPFAAVAGCVHVDALSLVEEVLRVDYERDRAHAVRKAAAEAQLRVFVFALCDRRAHAVPHRLAVDRLVGRETVWRRRAGGDDLLEEEVRRGRVLLENRVRVRNRRAHDRRLRDLERTGVAERARAADERRGAVERVVDDRVGMPRAAERELERGVLVSVRLAERHLRREARPPVRRVRRARRGRGGVDELVVAAIPLKLRSDKKLGVVDRVVLGDDLERVRAGRDLGAGDDERCGNERLRGCARGGLRNGYHRLAVERRREAVRVAHQESERIVCRRRLGHVERRLPEERRLLPEHLVLHVRGNLSEQRPAVHDRAPRRADDGKHVLVEFNAPPGRAEVDDESAAAVEVDDLDRVRAGLEVEAGDALRVAARAAALPCPGAAEAREPRGESVVAADGEAPVASGRNDQRAGRDEDDVVGVVGREVGVERGVERAAAAEGDALHRVRGGRVGPCGGIGEARLGDVHVGNLLFDLVHDGPESASHRAHAGRTRDGLPLALADPVLRVGRSGHYGAREMTASV